MSSDLELRWEWPAARQPEIKLVVEIGSVKKAGQGLFGVKKSPSIAGSLPDPMQLMGEVASGPTHLVGKSIQAVLPEVELGGAGKGDFLAMGVLGESICICAKKVDSASADLDDWTCPTD